MAVDTFVLSDKRPFVKILELISKQLIKFTPQDSEEVIRVNLYLDKFSPYSIDKSQCRDLLDGMLHALDVSINFPTERVRRNSRVKISTAEIFYELVEGIPSLLLNKLDSRSRGEQQKLIFQVFSDMMENSHGRSPVKTHLVKYLAQENLSFLTEAEALNTFLDLLDRYSRAINSLSRIVYLHRSIQEWSEAVINAEDSIGKETEEDKVVIEVGNVMTGYHDYIANFDSFQALGAQDRASIYTTDLQAESEPLNWITRLETPGFVQVGIDTIYMPVVSEHDFAMAMSNRLKDLLGSQVYQVPAFQVRPDACSSPRNSREHIPLTQPETTRSVAAPTVSFAVSTAPTPTTASISAPNIMSSGNSRAVVPAPAVLHSTGAQPFPFGLRDGARMAGRGPGPGLSQSLEDVSEIRRPFIDVGEYNAQCNALMQNWNVCFSNNRSVLQGYPDSLERQVQDLENEVKKCEDEQDPDAIDYLLTYNLERFQDDITRARQGGVIDDVSATKYYKLHAKYVQRLRPLKRVLIKKIKDSESKKTLANLHKQNLPVMVDSLDSKEWLEQVEFILRALKDEEDNNPILQNRLKEMVRVSIKSDALKPLYKVISNMGDIDEMIHTIINYCSNQSNIMTDLKDRLIKMKAPKTKLNMYSNSMLIIELISLLQDKDMIRVTPVFVYNLMVEKSLSAAHLPKFENFLNEALRKDNEQEEERDGMTDMERKHYLLAHPQARKKNMLNFKPLTELTMDKMALLNDYLITHCTSFNLESNFTENDKQLNTFFSDHNNQNNQSADGADDVNDAEDLEAQAFYSKSVKNRAEGHGDFCEVYLKHDRDYCKQVIENPKNRDKLRRCPCGIGAPHEVLHGSLRYCPHFLNLGTYNARREFLRLKRGCMKCLRGNHLSSSCRYKPSTCYYCRLAGKNDKGHSPGMCCAFNDTEFTELIKVIEAKLKSRKEAEKPSNVFTTGDDDGNVSDDDLENEEDLINALNCHKVSRYMTIEQEIRFCEENGMEVEVQDHENFKITLGDERLQAIGEVRLRIEPKEGEENKGVEESSEVLGLSDTGSESTFVTHQIAKKNRFRKLRILKLKLNTLGGVSSSTTFMYEVPVFNYKKNEFVKIEAAGVNHIGRAKMMSRDLQTIVSNILKPSNLHLVDLEVPRFDDISLIIGNDNAAIQIEDNIHLNKLSRPQNIRFYTSPVMKKPLVVGRAYGDETWTEAQIEENMVKPDTVMPSEPPKKLWEGFDGIRKKVDIVESKEKLPWNNEEDTDCWNKKDLQQTSTQSYYDCLLSDDEIFYSEGSDEEDEEEIYLSCFMVGNAMSVNNSDSKVTSEENGEKVVLSQEKNDTNTSNVLSCTDSEKHQATYGFEPKQTVHSNGINTSEDQDVKVDHNEGARCADDDKEADLIDEDQLQNDSVRLKAPTVRDLNILDNYLANEGNIPVQPSKCQECLEINCKQCIKFARSTPEETAVLQEMKSNISYVEKDDNSIQYIVKYVTDKPLSSLFTAKVSNYSQALSQARQVYSKFMTTPEGRAAVNNMVERGKSECHFRYLTEEETRQVLQGPHNFVSQTVAYKEASHSTKIRHVSNPSCLNRELGSSLNISQKNPGNIGNNADWPLNAFLMYSAAYSADVKSAYRKLQVSEDDRNFQLLILFDFSKDNWMEHPVVVQQVNLPFGVKQAGVFLELVLYEVGKKASSPLARIIICHFRLVDNLLYSFQTRELLETTGDEIFKLLEHHNLHLQHRYSTNKAHHYDFSVEQPQEVILGFRWCKLSDTICPATVLSHGRSRDGSKGKLLKDYQLDAHSITKRTILAIISQLWDPTGQFFSILKMSLKTIYSQICLANPGKSKSGYDTPVIASSDCLAHIAANICNSLTQIHQIEPLKRNIIPQYFQVHHLILSKDGSSYGMSSTLHVVSRNTQDHTDFHSRLARAVNRAKITSAPTSEALSYVLGLNMVSQWLESTYHMFSNDRDFFDCFVLGDSQSALLGLYTPPKDILFRSVQSKVLDLALNISTKFSKIRLQFMWDVAANNPSDLNSKLSDKIIEMSNSQFWRYGPAIFLSHEQLLNSTYATFSRESKRFEIVRQLTSQPSMDVEDDTSQVEDISQVCLNGSQQQVVDESSNIGKDIVNQHVCISQGSQKGRQESTQSLPEACSPPAEGVTSGQSHTLSCEGHLAQPLQGPMANDPQGVVTHSVPYLKVSGGQGDHSNMVKACLPNTDMLPSNQTASLNCEIQQVQSLQNPSLHRSEGILQTHPQASGDISTYQVRLKDKKVTPVPSFNVQTNNKQANLQLIDQTQYNVYSNQQDKPETLKEGDGLTAGGNDDISCSGNDDDDEGIQEHDSDHPHDSHDGDNYTKHDDRRSIYDWDLGGCDNPPTQRSAWFDNTPELAKMSTLTHEFLFKNNVSLSQLFHSEGLNIGLPHSHPFPIKDNIIVYQSLLDKSSSLGALLARTIYQYINPLIWTEKTRLKLKNEKVPIFDLQGRFQMAWHFLVLNSQKMHPPGRMTTSHEVFMENGLSCIGLKVDFRLFRPLILPLMGKDEKLLQLIFNQAHVFKGLDGRNYHRSITGTASQIRSSSYGVFFLNSQKVVSHFIQNCISCAKDKRGTIISKIASYHRLRVEAPFSRISVDILGPWLVKAGCNSRALIKVHALIAVCLSTGLLTHIMSDSITTEAIIRALWVLQMRHGIQITHIHSDRGTQFLKLGTVGSIPDGSPGPFIRLLIMLNAVRISAAQGQSSNVVEPSVRRLKELWKTGNRHINENRGSSFCELDWLISQLTSDLNKVPLDPSISDLAPADFSLAYRQLPVGFEYHDKTGNKRMLNKLSNDYKQLSSGFKNNRNLSSYLWRTKYLGQITRTCNVNDVVFIRTIRKLGLVCGVKQTQLHIHYVDGAGKKRQQWFKKSDVTHLLGGSTLLSNQVIPEHDVTKDLTNK